MFGPRITWTEERSFGGPLEPGRVDWVLRRLLQSRELPEIPRVRISP